MMKSIWSLMASICLIFSAGIVAAQDTQLVIDGSTTVGPIAKAFAEYYMEKNSDVEITVSESGSGNGAKSLINGTCDIASMSRFMKDTEFEAALENGVMPVPHVVALDAIAVVVHPSNPVEALSIEEVKSIYTGEVTNWNEVGGADAEIQVVSRDVNSGTFDTFESLALDGAAVVDEAETVGSNGAMLQRISATPNAIGYLGYGYLNETVKATKINGVDPNPATVLSGLYKLARPLFLFTDGYPELGTHLQLFVSLHLSPQGELLISKIGFVPRTTYLRLMQR
jgi:phosphate transport system substrate-binding protein